MHRIQPAQPAAHIGDRARSPAHWAAIHGNTKTLKFLFEKDPSLLEGKDNDGYTIAHCAAKHRYSSSSSSSSTTVSPPVTLGRSVEHLKQRCLLPVPNPPFHSPADNLYIFPVLSHFRTCVPSPLSWRCGGMLTRQNTERTRRSSSSSQRCLRWPTRWTRTTGRPHTMQPSMVARTC